MNKKDDQEIELIEALMSVIYSEDEITEEDRLQIEQMLDDKLIDEEFEKSYREFMAEPRNREQDIADGLESLNRLKRKHGVIQEAETRLARRQIFRRTLFRAAAVLIPLMIVGGVALYFNRIGENPTVLADRSADTAGVEKMYEQALDEEREIVLPDGSTVNLREGASIEYNSNFTENRLVKLDGEAFFSVAKMEGQPFEVLYNDVTVRVLGTEFLLSTTETASLVTLKCGSVEVTADARSVTLEPYQQLTVDSGTDNFSVMELSAADMEAMLRGELILRGEPIANAMVKISRFFGVGLEMSGLPSASVTIDIDTDDRLDDVLFAIQIVADNGFQYEIKGQQVVIRGSKAK